MAFVPGWNSRYAIQAQARLDTSGRYCLPAAPTKPPRPAVSLSRYRLNYYVQGNAGTCYAHSPKQMAEVMAKARGYDAFPISRRLIAWATKKMEGGGNPADGGSPTDAVVVMTSKGVGIAHEALFRYTESRAELAAQPPELVLLDAKKSHLIAPVRVKSLDEVIQMIDAGYPVANGWPAPASLQRQGSTFITDIGGILGGHSVLLWGYMQKGVIDDHRWLEMENHWDLIYRPLPAEVASKVVGYQPVRPDRTSSVWMRDDVYLQLCNQDPYTEHVTATDVEGILKGDVVRSPDFNDVVIWGDLA